MLMFFCNSLTGRKILEKVVFQKVVDLKVTRNDVLRHKFWNALNYFIFHDRIDYRDSPESINFGLKRTCWRFLKRGSNGILKFLPRTRLCWGPSAPCAAAIRRFCKKTAKRFFCSRTRRSRGLAPCTAVGRAAPGRRVLLYIL